MTTRSTWKDKVRSILPWRLYWGLKRLREEFRAFMTDGSLTELAKNYQTDKWGYHYYTPIYEMWFSSLRYKPVRLLEIGIGGYDKDHFGGDSLRMWKRYFRHGTITGIDLYEKSALEERRIKTYKGDQADPDFLREVVKSEGPFTIVIDDGSHMQSHIITTFETLFPLMPTGSLYVIEDTQTSYWPKFEGSTSRMNEVPSAMNYFISRVHMINKAEWLKDEQALNMPDQGIASIAFYHNLIFVVKG